MLRTNIELDERLVNEAMKLANMDTKKNLINYALKELVGKLKRRKLLELEGKASWTGGSEGRGRAGLKDITRL